MCATKLIKNAEGLEKRNCVDAKSCGIYDVILPNFSRQPFQVACDAESHEGGWTIFLRRMDGSVNFYRDWMEYKTGFGDLSGEFFMGLDKLHAMTADRNQELLVLLEDYEGQTWYEKYEDFAIGDEKQEYVLHTLGKASGTAGDSLSTHRGMKFSTHDRKIGPYGNCAALQAAAWWYNSIFSLCGESQLTGIYKDHHFATGVNWGTFHGLTYSFKKAVMMIRPKKSTQKPYNIKVKNINVFTNERESESQSTKQIIEVNTPNKLEYKFFPASGEIFTFKVRSPKDAHLVLSPSNLQGVQFYEIFIGGWENTISVIRKNGQKPDVAEVPTPRILSADEFRGFWVRWSDNVISVGHVGEARAFLSYDAGSLFPVNYVGICTGWGASGTWQIYKNFS
ncbi:ficolin-1-like [Drosophila innubila]|uniref:ficolin-1-like n=1 Tax=Drosophila innubila TaxID=198719 RepID=UPI00148CE677|nr:ficolin-1-like [Drosophila innubila]